MQIIERAGEIVRGKRGREIPSSEYLDTLSGIDRERVQRLIAAFQENGQFFQGEKIGVIAIGSSVKPERKRFHPLNDIDLRILNSAPANTAMRVGLIDRTIDTVSDFAKQYGLDFRYFPDHTESYKVVKVTMFGENGKAIRETGPFFLDYNNHDPSFVIKGPEGSLPLHVSISAAPEDTLQRHLQEERRQNQYFSVLAVI
ncbi:MAG: hypothetical protein HYT08_02450 [Candidatus Levybacteria bacterium]|nr:hypothetical protein [Candidatus Levybacteria bacterium]